ncbi:unnamed protein product, partial [Didymodactylos carnosus]
MLSLPTVPLRQLPVILYDDDPPPYPGPPVSSPSSTRNNYFKLLPQVSHSSPTFQLSTAYHRSISSLEPTNSTPINRGLVAVKWKTVYGQYKTVYTGNLAEDFLRIIPPSNTEERQRSKTMHEQQRRNSMPYEPHRHPNDMSSIRHRMLENQKQLEQLTFVSHSDEMKSYLEDERLALLLQNEEFLRELKKNKEFLAALKTDQMETTLSRPSHRRASHPVPQSVHIPSLSTKHTTLPTPPIIEQPKTPKVRARMLQNALTEIERGQTPKTSMVPIDPVTHNTGYSYGSGEFNSETLLTPFAWLLCLDDHNVFPSVLDFDSQRTETNEEFIARLRNMGKNSSRTLLRNEPDSDYHDSDDELQQRTVKSTTVTNT